MTSPKAADGPAPSGDSAFQKKDAPVGLTAPQVSSAPPTPMNKMNMSSELSRSPDPDKERISAEEAARLRNELAEIKKSHKELHDLVSYPLYFSGFLW